MSRQDRIAQLMALLNDAESSGDDDKIIEIKSDIFKEFGIEKNMGGMMDINNMTRPVSYMAAGGPMDAGDFGDAPGVDPKVDPLKDTRRLASARTSTTKPYVMFLKDADYTKPASVDDIKEYAKKYKIKIKLGEPIGSHTAFRNTLSALGVKEKTQEATNVLNQALQRAKKPLYVTGAAAGKDVVEDLIGVVTNTEFGRPGTKEIRDSVSKEIKDLKTTGNKIHGANPSKAKDAFFKTTLEKMYPVLKTAGKAATILSTVIAKKALGAFPIATEMGDAELPTESMKDQVVKNMDFSAPSANAQLLEQMSQDAAMNKRGGGMMNMDEMIRPLGYEVGGIVPKPKPKPRIVPKEKPIDFDALMAEFNKPENKAGPGAPTGIEKIIADQFTIDPRFTMKQKIKKMLGIGGDQGSSLMDDVEDLKTLLMKSEILDNKIGKVAPMSVFMELDNMSPKELMDAYIEYGGSKFR